MTDPQGQLFKTIEFKGSRLRSLWISAGFHASLLGVLLAVPFILTDKLPVKFSVVPLAPPPVRRAVLEEVTHYKQLLPVKPAVKPKQIPLVETPEPKLPEPRRIALAPPHELVESPKAPAVIPSTHTLDVPSPAPAVPRLEVRTGVFPSESMAKPALSVSALQVQTGRFGDPNAVGSGKPDRAASVVSLGSFNGSHGAGGGTEGSSRTIRQAGFGDADAGKPDAPKIRREVGPPQTPAEILSKPKPDYTEEARRLKVEGEVLIRVLFTAGGEVRVLEVVRGLGHGLDENALRAVEHIRFKPAQRDGQPADSTATVHIVFQLAY